MARVIRVGLMSAALSASLLSVHASVFGDEPASHPESQPEVPPTAFAARLYAGEIDEAITDLAERIKAGGDIDQACYELGFCQFLKSFERLSQELHRHGFLNKELPLSRQLINIPRFPVLVNDHPESLAYPEVREMILGWVNGLAAAESSFSRVRGEQACIPIAIARVRLDLNGDGKATPDENFWTVITQTIGQFAYGDLERSVTRFDRSDVEWFRGYCHLLSAPADIALAYDWPELFDYLAPMLFPKAVSKVPSIVDLPRGNNPLTSYDEIADAIGMIHLMRFKLIDPERLKSALHHLEQVIEQSRKMWRLVRAETDDEMEWIPSAKQHSSLAGMRLTEEQIQGWLEFLDVMEAVLQGKKLIPHWRWPDDQGINLRKAILDGRDFDLVLWAQGSAAVPYIEKGECLDWATTNRFSRLFGGNFMLYASWIN